MPEYICTVCESTGSPKKKTPGSIFIEIILWLFLIIPGLIYSIWQHSARHKVCAKCNNKNIIPINSPAGQKLLNK
ncbi:MAG: YqaE/Pmp3 family membrane protein [Thermodesulfobacteriota bacterium]